MNPLFIPYQNCEFIVLPNRISMMLNGDLQALLQMYILKEEHQNHIIRMYQHP
jgi:hypothetical protein